MIDASDFPGQPLAWGGNQSGHMLIGANIAVVLAVAVSAPFPLIVLSVALYLLVIELPQDRSTVALRIDCAVDAGFAASGAMLVALLLPVWWWGVLAWLLAVDVAMIAGMARRWVA